MARRAPSVIAGNSFRVSLPAPHDPNDVMISDSTTSESTPQQSSAPSTPFSSDSEPSDPASSDPASSDGRGDTADRPALSATGAAALARQLGERIFGHETETAFGEARLTFRAVALRDIAFRDCVSPRSADLVHPSGSDRSLHVRCDLTGRPFDVEPGGTVPVVEIPVRAGGGPQPPCEQLVHPELVKKGPEAVLRRLREAGLREQIRDYAARLVMLLRQLEATGQQETLGVVDPPPSFSSGHGGREEK